MNRCLTEGRKAFLARVAGIEAGSECERLAPLLSKLVDGEAGAEDLTTLRPHLRTCLSCRAALREFRSAPRTAAALLPTAAFALPGRPSLLDLPARVSEALAGWAHKTQTGTALAAPGRRDRAAARDRADGHGAGAAAAVGSGTSRARSQAQNSAGPAGVRAGLGRGRTGDEHEHGDRVDQRIRADRARTAADAVRRRR